MILDFAINKENHKDIFIKIISETFQETANKNLNRQEQQKKLIEKVFYSEKNKDFLDIIMNVFIKCDLIKTFEKIDNNIYKQLPLLKYKKSINTKNFYYSFSFLKLLSLFNEVLSMYITNTLSDIEKTIQKYFNEDNISIIGNNDIIEDEETTDEEEPINKNTQQEIKDLAQQIKEWLENNEKIINDLNECHLLDINEVFKNFYEVFDKKADHRNLINASMYIKVCLHSLLNSYAKLALKNSSKYISDIYKFDQLDYLDENIKNIENKNNRVFMKKLKKFMIECPIFKPYVEEGNEFEKLLIHYEQKVK